MQRRRGFKAQIPEEDFQAGPQGLKFYDMTPGKGALPKKGDRIAVHYEIRWHGITFMTSRYAAPCDKNGKVTISLNAVVMHGQSCS